MAISAQERGRIRHFLGYPSFASLAASIQLGFPAVSEPLFILDGSFQRLTPEGEEAVRRDLCECESCESQLSKARSRFVATQLDDLKVNPEEPSMLRRELNYWKQQLSSDLGAPINPNAASEYYGAMSAGSMNAKVFG